MRAKDIRELTEQELETRERELRESIFRFRLRRGTNQLESSAALRAAKRDLARIETVKTEREKKRGAQA